MRCLLLAILAIGVGVPSGTTAAEPEKNQKADAPKGKVTLTLTKATLAHFPATARTGINCSVTLDNATGAPLKVTTRFGFVWENMTLLIHDAEGKKIREVRLTDPEKQKAVEQAMTIPSGKTTVELRFSLPEKHGLPGTVKLRVVGTLPGSDFKEELMSNWIEVAVK